MDVIAFLTAQAALGTVASAATETGLQLSLAHGVRRLRRRNRWKSVVARLDSEVFVSDSGMPLAADALEDWLEDPSVASALEAPRQVGASQVLVERLLSHWRRHARAEYGAGHSEDDEARASEVVAWLVLHIAELAHPSLRWRLYHATLGRIEGRLEELWSAYRTDPNGREAVVEDLRSYLVAVGHRASQAPGVWWPVDAPGPEDVTVPVQVSPRGERDTQSPTLWAEDGDVELDGGVERPTTWFEASDRFRVSVVVGRPGSGKTWIARGEALAAATDALAAIADLDDDSPLTQVWESADGPPEIPLWVDAAQMTASADLAHVWGPLIVQSVANAPVTTMTSGQLDRLVGALEDAATSGRGKWRVVVDGLDEAANPEILIGHFLDTLIRDPGTRVRIMTRPTRLLPRLEFLGLPGVGAVVELLDLDPAYLQALLRAWLPDAKARSILADHLEDSAVLSDLARVPLFGTWLCILARDGSGEGLPETRAGVIEAIVRRLLTAEHRASQVDISPDALLRLLDEAAELAWAMATAKPWKRVLTSRLHDQLGLPADALDGILVATGSPSGDREWLHLSIQEWLCARHIAAVEAQAGTGAALDLLAANWWRIDEWSEVVAYCGATLQSPGRLLIRLRDHDVGGYLYPYLAQLAYSESPRRLGWAAPGLWRSLMAMACLVPEGALATRALRRAQAPTQWWISLLRQVHEWQLPLRRLSITGDEEVWGIAAERIAMIDSAVTLASEMGVDPASLRLLLAIQGVPYERGTDRAVAVDQARLAVMAARTVDERIIAAEELHDQDVLWSLAQDADWRVRAIVARRLQDQALLATLVDDEQAEVREAVAARLEDQNLLWELRSDEAFIVRWVVADRVESVARLAELAKDPNPDVREAVARRLEAESVGALFEDDPSADVRLAVVERTADAQRLGRLLGDSDEQVRAAAISRLCEVLDPEKHDPTRDPWRRTISDPSRKVREALVWGSKSRDVFCALANDPHPAVRAAVAARLSSDDPLHREMAKDPSARVRGAVARRTMDPSVLEILVDDPDEFVRANAVTSIDEPAVLWRVRTDPSHYVRSVWTGRIEEIAVFLMDFIERSDLVAEWWWLWRLIPVLEADQANDTRPELRDALAEVSAARFAQAIARS